MLSRIAGELVVDLAFQYVVPCLLREVASLATRQALGGPRQRSIQRRAKAPRLWVVPQPSARSVLTVVSQTPGRMRVRVEGLRGDPARAALLAEPLRALPGVRVARANGLTGAILVEYDPACVSGGDILSALENNPALHLVRSTVQLADPGSASIGGRRPQLALIGV